MKENVAAAEAAEEAKQYERELRLCAQSVQNKFSPYGAERLPAYHSRFTGPSKTGFRLISVGQSGRRCNCCGRSLFY